MATMDDLDKLPSDLVWEQDGHLSDIVLSTLADGQALIVPLEAFSHLEQCDHCTTRFGAEALLSTHAGELLTELGKPSKAPASVKPRVAAVLPEKLVSALPRRAVWGALILGACGAMPALLADGMRVTSAAGTIGRSILMFSRGMVLVAKSETFTPLMFLAAMVLMISGLVVSRVSRPGSANGLAQEGSV